MASKLQIITEMFNREILKVAGSYEDWTSFLRCASNNFKYDFADQVLIYAQRPDATACAEIEVWNKRMNRWVNRGATGIALLDYSGNCQKLRYVFDVSDTNSYYGYEVPRWKVKERYHDEIAQALINSFGEVAEGELESVIDDTARNMAEENVIDYIAALKESADGSFLEDLDDDNIKVIFSNILAGSIGYMMMTRCGFNADDFYDFEDFKDIFNFNTPSTVISMGVAVSDIAEMGLREIEITVKNIQKNEQKRNRTFVKAKETEYDEVAKEKTHTERSNENGTDELQTSGGLQDSEPDITDRGEHYSWKVRYDEKEVPGGEQESLLHSADSEGRAYEDSQGNGAAGTENGGTADRTDYEVAESDGITQGEQPDEMGSDDEQHSFYGGGNGPSGTDLQLSGHNFDARWNGIEYFYHDKQKNELIRTYLSLHTDEIAAFYESHSDSKERSDFIMSFFNSAPYEMTLSNGVKVGFEAYSDAIRLWRDDGTELREAWERWFQIERSVYGMILLEEWTEPQALLLPSVDNQLDFLDMKVKDSVLPLPQAAVDYILGAGSGFSEGKMRIYRQFTESLSKEDNIRFLKNEYGTGGGSDAIPGTGYWESHDAKGIEISDHYSVPERRTLLKWNYVEKRIFELIKIDRYLNAKEKEMYPQWLDNKTTQEAEWERTNAISKFICDSPEEKELPKEYKYVYNLGDTVYIGVDEYTILSLEDPVILNDSKFPLFNEELSKAEFEKKMQENPANNHLRVEVETERLVVDTENEPEIDESNKPDFLIQYEQIKRDNPDGIILMRAGGFYFAFGKDAENLAKHTNYRAVGKNLYGNVFTPCCKVLDYNLSYCVQELNGSNIGIIVTDTDRGIVDRYPVPSAEIDNTDAAYTDAFFVNDGSNNVEWVYYNPDGNDGNGQFVHNLFTYDDIITAADLYADEKDFFDYLGFVSKQTISDRGTKEFDNYIAYLPAPVDLTGCTKETMLSLVSEAESVERSVLTDEKAENTESITENRYIPLYREYISEKNKNPDIILLYQVGDFFEAMNDDALTVSKALDLTLTSRKIDDNEKIPMCGFPQHRLETYINMLNDRGFDVSVSSLENGERKIVSVISQNKEDPVESKPIGKIDYLNSDGTVRESIEYTSEYRLVNDIKEENFFDEPMSVYVYSDKDGNSISTDFVKNLANDLNRFEVIPSPYLEEEPINDELIGREVIIDGDSYIVESVSQKSGDVSMRDTSTIYPINRVEKIGFVREHLAPSPQMKRTSKVVPHVLHPEINTEYRTNFRIEDDEIGVDTPLEQFYHNIRAIQLLKKLENENRLAPPTEQRMLADYVGWGGLSEFFKEDNPHYTELKGVLSDGEYAAARESTLTAFYTPPVVIRAMYDALQNMGFSDGNILEPSCGTGHFIGMLPQSMQNSKFYGVELDSISGRIARQLYQKSNIAVQGYEKALLPDSFFDVAIGNVPFGQFKVVDKKYDKNNWLIHDYFFGKTLDKVRPGGIIAFITSSGTMDKKNPAVRKYIAQRAELLGAVRLPNNTFKANAGTEVTSDIIFLQKRDTLVNDEPDWVFLDRDENGNEMNKYFVDNPEMVLGEMVMESSQFGQSLTCKPYEDRDLSDLLSEAIQNIHADFSELDVSEIDEIEDNSIPADPDVKNFSFTVADGKIYYRQNSRMNPVDVSATAENRIKGMIKIRDCVRELIRLQTDDFPDSSIKSEQDKLNYIYDSFTKKYGLLNSRANRLVFSDDSSYCLLCSLEIIGENGELKRKADMFTKRTIKPHVKVTAVSTASEALAVSIGEKARVDMPFMCELTGKSEQEIFEELKGVIFLNPEYTSEYGYKEKYLTSDEYLSGNVRQKLELAKRTAKLYPEDYNINVEMLEKVQPQDLSASEISVRLGATWLPTDDVQNFIFELLQTPRYAQWNIKVHYSEYTAEWNIENKNYDKSNVMANSTYGTERVNAYKIIEETLNLKDVRIFDYVEDVNGNKKPVLNKKETAIAQGKQEMIKQAFQDWIWKDPERRERLVRKYNDLFNSMRAREYDGSHITFSGMNPEISLRPHQINAVARIMYGGNSLLAHVVGAGKTFGIVAAAQESKRLGLCSKSLIVVPNHLTEQWASEYLQLYPSANILVATKKDFETKNRKKFCARIATGDYDAVIIGHSQFEKIPVSIERQQYMLQKQIDEITDGIIQVKANRGERFTIKQLEKTKKSLQVKLDKLNDQSRKDDVVTFEELGVDRLFVDEAHNFKNLFLYTKMRNVGGIAQTEAQKSSDLFMKCRYLDEVTESKGVIFATGTPVSNSMVELYTMQRYLQYETLAERNLQHFDAWASTFGETVTAIELAPEGTGYRSKTRFAKFYNLPELMMMFRQVADIQTADMLNLPVPKAVYHNIAVKPTDIQKELVASLSERAEKVRKKMVDSSVDNMLLITNDGRKLALDQRLTNEMLPDDPNSKVSACVNNVYEIWEKTSEQRSTQLIFCDLSTPHNDGRFNVYDDIRKKLISKGVPENEIAFIHDADSEAKKKELFSKVRTGKVRVLIGSTAKMGAGTNVQQKLIAIHHTDCPWRPADLQQREGRIIRQGNENPEVNIYSYVAEETFDAYLYQLVENKQKFIGQIMTSKSPVRSAEDVDEQALSYAEIKALATGNPYIKEKMDLDVAVSKLKLLKQNHLSQKYALEDKIIKFYPQEIKRFEERIDGYNSDIERVKNNTVLNNDGFSAMIVEDVSYSEKKAAGTAILAACKAMTSPESKEIGSYRGFKLELSFETFEKQYVLTLVGSLRHSVPLGADIFGNISRIDNMISSLPDKMADCKERLVNTKNQLENAKAEVERPFPQEEELSKKNERLAELNALLDMNHTENEIADGEQENNNMEKTCREVTRQKSL